MDEAYDAIQNLSDEQQEEWNTVAPNAEHNQQNDEAQVTDDEPGLQYDINRDAGIQERPVAETVQTTERMRN